ncbi:phosphotransferase [Terrabacter sp. 2RAF25]|uniref:phosphotransferase n=1 Tax=Terrabacter sp. 2RAF25 TaxID=3232998 RepID=UPI003F9DC8A5
MTTAWPAAPTGFDWTEVDPLVGLVQPVVEGEGRPGGVHQIRWEPEQSARVAFDHRNGEVVVYEARQGSVHRSGLSQDPGLPGVASVLDPVKVAARLEHLLGKPVRNCTVTPVSYRPGSRCVIRCDVLLPSGRRTVFVKLLARGTGEYVESLRALAGGRGGRAVVPALVGCWADLGAVVTAGVTGPTASDLLTDVASPARDRVRLVAGLGRLLADIHRTSPGPHTSARRHGTADELDELTSYLAAAWHADPPTALSLGWSLDRLADAPPRERSLVFSHGSYRAGQVMVDGDRLAVLDLDGAGLADPARDLGNATAYLDWQRMRTGSAATPDLVGALLQGYADAGGQAEPDAVDWWHAASLLKIGGRRYRSLDTTHWEAVPSLVAAASGVLERRRDRRLRRSAAHRRPQRSPELTDPRSMTALLREQLRAGGLDGGRIVSAETLRLAPGRRVVVRYRVTGGSEGPVDVIAKAYADHGRAVVAHENLVLFDRLRDPEVRCGTQRPIGVHPHLGIVLCRAAAGQPVTPSPGGPRRVPVAAATSPGAPREVALDEVDVVRAAGLLGRWLRTVHATRAGAGRRLEVGHEVANCGLWAERIGRVDARLLAPARELVDLLDTRAATLPDVGDALIHKDLHLGHVLVGDRGQVTVIDLDEARMGDPAFDVAHLCAYAEESRSGQVEHAVRAFLDAYGDVPGAGAQRRLAFFRAYTLLKITRQQLAGQVTDELVQSSRHRLGQGVACLRG